MSDLMKERCRGRHRVMRGIHINQRTLERLVAPVHKETSYREAVGPGERRALKMDVEAIDDSRKQQLEATGRGSRQPAFDQLGIVIAIETRKNAACRAHDLFNLNPIELPVEARCIVALGEAANIALRMMPCVELLAPRISNSGKN